MKDLPNLRRDAADFRTIAEAMPHLIWVTDASGKVEYVNSRWFEYTGLDVEALAKPGGKNAVHPEDLDETWERWKTALETGEPYEIEYRLRRHLDSTYRWFVARAMPVRDETGTISNWIGSATDIDAQRRTSDNLRFVIEAASGLNGSDTIDAICAKLADLAVARISDWCFIVLSQNGEYRVNAIAHRDPAMIRYVEQFRDRYPIQGGSGTDIAVRKNISILTPVITRQDIAAAAQDELHLQILQKLEMHSAMTVPLTGTSGVTHGAVVFLSAESARLFTNDDLEVVERVARRAADAMDTALTLHNERMRSQRMKFIAKASELVFESLEPENAFERLCDFVVTEMADLAYVMRFEADGALRTVACAHGDPSKRNIAERLRGARTLKPASEEIAARMLSQHRAVLHETVRTDDILPHMWEYLAPDVRALDVRSAITVPLFARGETFGALVVYWCQPGRRYTEDDIPVFEDLGRRLSVAIEHATAFERERNIAVSLQQALLPAEDLLPVRKGLAFDVEYRASSTESRVGGDWYDAFARSDGSIIVCVGDVTGRGLNAAGLMGKLRQSIGIASIYEREPAEILDAVDFHLRSRRAHAIATAFIGIIDPSHTRMRFATAGHPPPLLRRRSGALEELRSEGLPLGLRDYARGTNNEVSLEDSELLMLYTDGLIEGTHDITFGERRLREVAASQAIMYVRNPAKLLCDACLPRDAQDDTAVLTVRFGERSQWQFDAENAEAAGDARKSFVAQLRGRVRSDLALSAAELVFGELVGNVVRHAPGPIDVQLDLSADDPVLHVIDRGMGFVRDPGLPMDPLSESGRGLYIIAQLAKNIRVERIPGFGNHITAALNV